tara:strand:- start:7612 stop:8013 length:402 start_codon:yes stop_codon:yes gene_type:complete
MVRKRIDIDVNMELDGSLTFAEIEKRILTKINFYIIDLLSNGKQINGLEVGYKLRVVLEDSKYLHVMNPDIGGTSNYIGKFQRTDTFLNNKIQEPEENEYHFILNYDDQNELYVCVNRDIQKERDKTIEEILN